MPRLKKIKTKSAGAWLLLAAPEMLCFTRISYISASQPANFVLIFFLIYASKHPKRQPYDSPKQLPFDSPYRGLLPVMLAQLLPKARQSTDPKS